MFKQIKNGLQIVALCAIQLLAIGAAFSAEKPAWQSDWDTTLQAAKKEGESISSSKDRSTWT